MATDLPSSLRGGRYVILKPLGEGSQGETFEAVDKREGRLVALKRFRVNAAKAWKDVELAEREATTLASLEHPLLPHYVEHFEEDGALVLVMERIEGESLAARRKNGHRFSVPEIERLLRDASLALAYLHGRAPPVVHRDLKPGNVIQRPDGSFAFVDFGAVRDRLKPAGGSTVVGTFGYMAPEQFQGRASAASHLRLGLRLRSRPPPRWWSRGSPRSSASSRSSSAADPPPSRAHPHARSATTFYVAYASSLPSRRRPKRSGARA